MTLDFDENDLHTLNKGLVQLPYGEVARLIAKINEQIEKQQQQADSMESAIYK